MIETKEQYERMSDGYLDDFRYAGVAHKDVLETIEALREVARASKHHAARGYANSQPAWRFVVLDKLDDLPDWIKEDG